MGTRGGLRNEHCGIGLVMGVNQVNTRQFCHEFGAGKHFDMRLGLGDTPNLFEHDGVSHSGSVLQATVRKIRGEREERKVRKRLLQDSKMG